MKRKYIDVEKLLQEIKQYNYYITYRDVLEEINNAPAASVIPIDYIENEIKTYPHETWQDEAEYQYPTCLKLLLENWRNRK